MLARGSVFLKMNIIWDTNKPNETRLLCMPKEDAQSFCEKSIVHNKEIAEIELFQHNLETDEWEFVCSY